MTQQQSGPDQTSTPHRDKVREFLGSSSLTAETFAAAARERALSPDFPTPNCINPTEVADFAVTGQLPEELREHLDGCEYCAALTESLAPDPSACRSFLSEIATAREQIRERSKAGVAAIDLNQVPVLAAPRLAPTWRRYFVPGLAAAAGVIICGSGIVYWNAQRRPSFGAKTSGPVTFSKPISQAGLGNVVLTPERPKKLQSMRNDKPVVLEVGLNNEKIKPSYYPGVAAAVTTLSLDSTTDAAAGAHLAELRKRYSETLAQVISAKQFQDASDVSKADQATCLNISRAASDNGLTVQTGKNPSICVIKLGSASLRVNPTQNVDSTLYYVRILTSAKGDTTALNEAAEKVDVQLKPDTAAASNSADSPAHKPNP